MTDIVWSPQIRTLTSVQETMNHTEPLLDTATKLEHNFEGMATTVDAVAGSIENTLQSARLSEKAYMAGVAGRQAAEAGARFLNTGLDIIRSASDTLTDDERQEIDMMFTQATQAVADAIWNLDYQKKR